MLNVLRAFGGGQPIAPQTLRVSAAREDSLAGQSTTPWTSTAYCPGRGLVRRHMRNRGSAETAELRAPLWVAAKHKRRTRRLVHDKAPGSHLGLLTSSLSLLTSVLAGVAALTIGGCPLEVSPLALPRFTMPTRSTSIALTSDDRRLVVVNRQTNSVSVLEVRTTLGLDTANKLAEVPVGQDPRCVAINPEDTTAYVTNAVSGTVSVIELGADNSLEVVSEIAVGSEPRGCALTPNGLRLFVANHSKQVQVVVEPAHGILNRHV